jgi:hypothetical protein
MAEKAVLNCVELVCVEAEQAYCQCPGARTRRRAGCSSNGWTGSLNDDASPERSHRTKSPHFGRSDRRERALSDVAVNLSTVRSKVADAALRSGRSPDAVRFVLVTKTVAPERVLEAVRGCDPSN